MGKSTSESAGRPLTFDPDVVLFDILNVFWERGYEHTSIGDIETATNLTRPSLYNTFGNKRAMYEKGLDLYVEKMDSFIGGYLTDGEAGLEDLVSFVRALLDSFNDTSYATGCAIINAIAAHGDLDAFVVSRAQRYRSMLRVGIEQTLRRAVARGEVQSSTVDVLAERMHTYLVGVNILARQNDTFERIDTTGDAIISGIRSWNQN